MKLIQSGASPFVRSIRVALLETGLDDQVEKIDVTTTALDSDPQVIATNPSGRIPALIREDGPALYDSRVIARYLDTLANGALYPDARLWEVLTLEATAHGIMEAAVTMTYEVRLRPEDKVYDVWLDAQWAKIGQSLDAISDKWMSHLHGPVDMAQIALGCALEYLDLRHDARGWREGHDAIAQWQTDFAKLPAMQATQP